MNFMMYILFITLLLICVDKAIPQTTPGPECFCFEEFEQAQWLANPIGVETARDGTNRLFVGEQRGIIWIFLDDGTKITEPYVNLTDRVHLTSAGGLMAFTFHPDYVVNGKAYLYYVTEQGQDLYMRTSEVFVSGTDPNKLDLDTERVLLDIPIEIPDHIGGGFLFGPDGYLYIMIGDEWNQLHSQNKSTYNAAAHRIDVDSRTGGLEYGIPPDNPFLDEPTTLPEMYAFGLRNPWKASVDPGDRNTGTGAGRIFIGDVGMDSWEEVDLLQAGGNYGWSAWEGPQCMDPPLCDTIGDEHIGPLISYNHTVGQCVIGGHVYRGSNYPQMNGWYIAADYSVAKFFAMYEVEVNIWAWQWIPVCNTCPDGLVNIFPYYIHAIGVDDFDELYFASTESFSPDDGAGSLFKIITLEQP